MATIRWRRCRWRAPDYNSIALSHHRRNRECRLYFGIHWSGLYCFGGVVARCCSIKINNYIYHGLMMRRRLATTLLSIFFLRCFRCYWPTVCCAVVQSVSFLFVYFSLCVIHLYHFNVSCLKIYILYHYFVFFFKCLFLVVLFLVGAFVSQKKKHTKKKIVPLLSTSTD